MEDVDCFVACGPESSLHFFASCFVCRLDLSTLASDVLREAHLNKCLNSMESGTSSAPTLALALPTDYASSQTSSFSMQHMSSKESLTVAESDDCSAGQSEEVDEDLADFRPLLLPGVGLDAGGLRAQDFTCIICDLKLSKRNITARCQHLKR